MCRFICEYSGSGLNGGCLLFIQSKSLFQAVMSEECDPMRERAGEGFALPFAHASGFQMTRNRKVICYVG